MVVAPGRVELPTFGLGNRCSIHLSYGAKVKLAHYLMAIYGHKDGGRRLSSARDPSLRLKNGCAQDDAPGRDSNGSGLWGQFVQSEVEFQHVDSRFAEEPQVALVGVLLN